MVVLVCNLEDESLGLDAVHLVVGHDAGFFEHLECKQFFRGLLLHKHDLAKVAATQRLHDVVAFQQSSWVSVLV